MPSLDILKWEQSGRRFDFQGHDVFYRDAGTGEVLLLIHGFPTASWDWCRVWDELALQYRVIAADMLGFGFSDKPAQHNYSLIEQADLHQQLCQQLEVSACHILAHDYGVSVAQ